MPDVSHPWRLLPGTIPPGAVSETLIRTPALAARPAEERMVGRSKYWTRTVFVDHADLYATVLRARRAAALPEVRGIRRILDTQGIPRRGRVLDIACGVGRHIVPLARSGYFAVGCDFSPGMIAESKRWARACRLGDDRIRFYRSDYRRIDRTLRRAREPRFDAAICVFTSMGHYGEKGDVATLRAVRRSVRPGGIFVLEMGDRDWVLRNYQPTSVSRTGHELEIHERRRFDWERSVMHSRWTFFRGVGARKRRALTQEITVRLYSLHELRNLLERSGWEYLGSYGSLSSLEPVSLRSHRLVVVGRRPVRGGR